MGSEKFNQTQLRLAWSFIGSIVVWLFYYSIYVVSIDTIPGTNTPYLAADGNTNKLIFKHTKYTTYLEYVWGEHTIGFVFFTSLIVIIGGLLLYRGYKDNWEFLYE